MVEAGVLAPGERAELIDGEVLAMPPQGSLHATAVRLAEEALRAAFGAGYDIRVQMPLALDPSSEPEPDVAVVRGSPRDYRDAHPTSALLVVEVADTTLGYDRDQKGSLYARAGVAEYWIVNLLDRRVEVCRDPTPESQARYGWTYRNVRSYATGDQIAPLALPRPPSRSRTSSPDTGWLRGRTRTLARVAVLYVGSGGSVDGHVDVAGGARPFARPRAEQIDVGAEIYGRMTLTPALRAAAWRRRSRVASPRSLR